MIVEISKKCRICKNHNLYEIINLGETTPANNFYDVNESNHFDKYPLILDHCSDCNNVQLRHILDIDTLYSHYSYITPKSSALTEHYDGLHAYLNNSFKDLKDKKVLEVGSNSGDLLYHLKDSVKQVLGVDPASNVVDIANEKGIETICNFFSKEVARSIVNDMNFKADIILARHMFAHNPYPNNLLGGMKEIINQNKDSIILIENAYVIDTFLKGEFDQIYHEHMFYYSASSIKYLLESEGLFLIDIFQSSIHGGSMVFVASAHKKKMTTKLKKVLEDENFYFNEGNILQHFIHHSNEVRNQTINYLEKYISEGKKIGVYGVPAKAFTMLSYLTLDSKQLDFCIDTTPTKIGKIFPGVNLPILSEETLSELEYDVIIICAWNYKKEILLKSKQIFKSGTKLIFPLPEFNVLEV